MSAIYFVEIADRPKKRTVYNWKKTYSSRFQWRVFLFPTLLSLVGLALLFVTFLPVNGVLAGSGGGANYPPKLADLAPTVGQSNTLASDRIVSAKSEPTDLPVVNLASTNINTLNLAGTVQWPLRGTITTYYSSYHQGIDIAARFGSNILPVMEGVVIEVGHLNWGFGNYLVIAHKDGFKSLYGHLSTINVKVGDLVNLKTVIAQEGNSGYSTGPHLMLEVFHNNTTLNPLLVLPH